MKIAHIVCTYPPYYGGMGNVVFQTTQALRNRGHEVLTITPQYKEPTTQDVAHVKRLSPSVSYGNAARLPQIKQELDQYDIVHLHYPFFGTANLVRKWKERNPQKKLVITYHMDTRSPDWKGLIFSLYARFWMPKILQAADFCLVSSIDYIKESDAAKIYNQSQDKWKGLPFGVDTNRFFPREKSSALFERYDLDIQAPTIIFVGGMDEAHYFKGVPVLLKALTMLHNAGLDIQALFVGDGSLKADFEKKSHIYGISNIVRFAGKVSDTELPDHYAMADLCILPSIAKNEAFGMVLLEAYASGVPVLASDLPGVRTVAEHAGVVVPPNNAHALAQQIDEFFQPNIDREAIKKQAREKAEALFSWDHIAAELEEIYTTVLSKK